MGRCVGSWCWSLSTWRHSPRVVATFPAGLLFVTRLFARCVFFVRLPELELSVAMDWRRREGGWRICGEGVVPWRESLQSASNTSAQRRCRVAKAERSEDEIWEANRRAT